MPAALVALEDRFWTQIQKPAPVHQICPTLMEPSVRVHAPTLLLSGTEGHVLLALLELTLTEPTCATLALLEQNIIQTTTHAACQIHDHYKQVLYLKYH